MNFYFSGSCRQDVDQYLINKDAYRLLTFAYQKEIHEYLALAEAEGKSCNLIIDSGAFTSWNSGKPVELQELLDNNKYLLDNHGDKHTFTFISLDVMPGERDRAPTPDEIQAGMDKSLENLAVLHRELSAPVLPVFHSGEPVSFRDALLEYSNYLCLSMNQGMSEMERVNWAQRVAPKGAKLHGLAATGNTMLKAVPWHSVDSAGWLMVAAMGSILIHNGKRFFSLSISDDSPNLKTRGKHLQNRHDKEMLCDIIISRGYTPEELADDYGKRWLWNIDTWLMMQRTIDYKAGNKQNSLFD